MPRGVPSAPWLAVALATAGCAPTLQLREPRPATPARFEASGGVALEQAALDRWWLLFSDSQLSGLVEQALTNGADARLAIARLDEARAIRSAALARFRVQGDIQANGSLQRNEVLSGGGVGALGGLAGGGAGQPGQPGQPAAPGGGGLTGLGGLFGGDVNQASVNFNASWEVDLFGRRGATRRAADADLAAARFLYEGSRAALAADVADALFNARGLAVQLADARETARIQRDLRGVLAIRAQRGIAAEADVARIDADLGQADAQTAQLAAELTAAKRVLLVLTGASTATTAELDIHGSLADPPPAPATLPGQLLARRPDVREADARFRSAAAQSELRRLELFPRITLTPGVGLSTQGGGIEQTLATWTLGAGLVLPILDRPRLLSELRAQNARAEQAALTYERTVQTAFSEADQALVRLEADRRRVAFLAAGERRARVSYDAARTLFTRGLNDLQTLLDAERTWRGTRQALAAARVDALRRAVASFRALGGGWAAAQTEETGR